MRLNHVKPHGELYLTGVKDRETARGIVRAVRAVDPDLILLMAGPLVAEECDRSGVPMIHEGYVDLDYRPDGSWYLKGKGRTRCRVDCSQGRWPSGEAGLRRVDGTWLNVPAQSICMHGDGPNAD